MPRVAASRKMIDDRRPILDAYLVLHQMRKVVVFVEMSGRLGKDAVELSSQGPVLDALDFLRQVYLAVPDFERRHLGQGAHSGPVCFDGRGRGCPRPLVSKL